MGKRQYPNFAVAQTPRALVNIQVAHVRALPSHSSELLCQVLFGWPVEILDRNDEGWYNVRTHFPYEGWVSYKSLSLYSANEWNSMCAESNFRVVQFPEYAMQIQKMSNHVLSNFPALGFYDLGEPKFLDFVPIHYLPGSLIEIEDFQKVDNSLFHYPSVYEQFMGIQYLWGGNSHQGIDCSGLVVMYFFLRGYLVPRDASQQALLGINIDFNKKDVNFFSDFETGDLLFFGEELGKITHVAIYDRAEFYIHASGEVCTGNLDTDSIQDAEDLYRLETLQFARRIDLETLPKVKDMFLSVG